MPRDLVGDRFLDRLERVDVLYLNLGAKCIGGADRDVGFDAHLALFHVCIAVAEISEEQLQLFRKTARGLGIVDDRLGDELHERDAGAIEVDEGAIRPLMRGTRSVFLQMDTRDGYAGELPARDERALV